YKVVALYDTEKAGASTSNIVMFGSIFPVQRIGHNVQYNRYASIYWGLPSSEVVMSAMNKVAPKSGESIIDRSPVVAASRMAPAGAPQAKTYKNTALDYIYNVDMMMYNGYCGIKIGDLYYVSSWQGDGIRLINEYNTMIEEWKPNGLNRSVLSMVYFPEKNQLYCGSLEDIYILDLNNHNRVIETIEGVPSRHMTYLPDLEIKGNKGVLMAGGWEDAKFFTLDGKYLEESGFDFTGLAVSGTAYHDGKVYAASQSGPNSNEIYVFDLASRQQIGAPIQVAEDPAVYNILNPEGYEDVTISNLSVAGGLTTCTLEDGTVALVAGYQCDYVYSQLMFLELESAPERAGYDLYRDGKLIAKNLTTRRFPEELTPGTYEYTVKAIYTGNVESDFSPVTTVKIENYDNCLPVKGLKAHETNRWVVLDWDVPSGSTGFVGFTVFRDGTKLAELWNDAVALNYNDLSDLKIGTTYTYRLEALYSSGCTASDSVKITLTNEGTAMAPFGLNLTQKKNASSSSDKKLFDVTAEWETPMFEDAMSIGYGGGVMVAYNSFSNDLPKEYWAAIGWDSTDLKLYKDLYLVGMEYMLGDNTRSFEAFVYLNDEQVYSESLDRATAQNWQTMYFKHSFEMNQPKEVAVGYHIKYNEDASPVAIDYSYNKPRYSDLLSFDGKTFVSLASYDIVGSWAIRALVARKRDIVAATNADGTLNPTLLEGKLIRVTESSIPVSLKQTPVKLMNLPSPKAPLTLQGFNIYRQRMDIDEAEVKLNTSLLKTFSFTEAQPLPSGEYDYTVEAVYADTTVKTTEPITLGDESTEEELNGMKLVLYPNPTSDIVYINGEYAHLQILDLNGRVLRQLPAISQISLNGMTPGTYFFRFTDESGRMATYKVVIK
ncbi:MAG: T9SS type A sorting domain-containing protein, partial [Bacteroidales bacterium]|nr:T9SS type A sorting domain-containing protein [Bacteroidales bacterium]